MPIRLVLGLLKGALIGGLVGFALAKLGFVAPGAVFAYLGIAITGVLVGLVAGKPIWAEGARIEAGMKAFAGAVLSLGLLWAVRRWLTIPLPFSLGELSQPNAALGETAANGTLGGLAMSSYAIVAAALGAFFEVDNTPDPDSKSGGATKSTKGQPAAAASQSKKRIASSSSTGDPELDALLADDDAPPAEKKGRR